MFSAIGIDRDSRLNAWCVTAQCTYRWFLGAVAGAEANLEIQRAVIGGRKAYATLREDLKRGCVLPPIVLAEASGIIEVEQNGAIKPLAQLSDELGALTGDSVYIIDGLQRTNVIRQIVTELQGDEAETFLNRQVRVEFWLGATFGAIAYRMLLLNAGQRPMSMKHQIEVLSSRLKHSLSSIQGIEIFTVGDARRRTKPGQFQLAKLSQAFQAWLQGQPNIDVRNVVMEELLADGAIETLAQSIGGAEHGDEGSGFRRLVAWIVEMDHMLDGEQLSFFGNETVLQGLAAAVGGSERHPKISTRVWPALEELKRDVGDPSVTNALGVDEFNQLRTGFDVSKVNVGSATRELVFGAFQELFFSSGQRSMRECWETVASRI